MKGRQRQKERRLKSAEEVALQVFVKYQSSAEFSPTFAPTIFFFFWFSDSLGWQC
jgi:hypothetical protein